MTDDMLRELAECRREGEKLIKRWSRRRVRLHPVEREVFYSEVAALERALDAIRLLRDQGDDQGTS